VKNGGYLGRVVVGARPASLRLFVAARPSWRKRIARPAAVACIEGFPRSANTYATEMFQRRNGPLPLAHHLHVPGQVLRAVQLGLPSVVLVRPPLDALSSLLIVDERLSIELAVWSYVDFHRRVWVARESVAACQFHEVIGDASVVSRRLNERFGTRFDDRPVSRTERGELLRMMTNSHHAVADRSSRWGSTTPDPEKDRRKAALLGTLRRTARLAEAEEWHSRWAERACGSALTATVG
jgi:hypothetical protein